MMLQSVVLTTLICATTARQPLTPTKRTGSSVNFESLLRALETQNGQPKAIPEDDIVETLKAFQKNVFTLEKALQNTYDESLQQDVRAELMEYYRSELGEYYYRIGKLFSEATSDQSSRILADNDVLVFKDPSRPDEDMIIDNALVVLGLSLHYRPGSDDAKRLASELEAMKASTKDLGDSERAMAELQAMRDSYMEKTMAEAERVVSDQPIEAAIAAYQNNIVRLEQFLGTPEGQKIEDELKSKLGDLYYRVGQTFGEATDEECTKLVQGQNVLLIGANTAPANDVILENAMIAFRTSLHYRPGVAEVESAMSKLQEAQAAAKLQEQLR